jgi:hypothetical protein
LQVLRTPGFEQDASKAWVGQVTGFEDGQISVMWSDKEQSLVGPKELVIVEDDSEAVRMPHSKQVVEKS